jgi:fluoride exporter
VFLGGVAGTLLRVWIAQTFATGAADWPWAIFAVNISGSFALAYFATQLRERLPQSTYRHRLLATGFCGAYTTFSTMQLEILRMIDHSRYGLAAGYASASVAAGLTAIWAGATLVRRVTVTT